MTTEPTQIQPQEQLEESLNLRDELHKFMMHWKWFVLSIFLCVGLSFVYLRYATPQFEVRSSLLLKQEQVGARSEMAAFQDLGMLSGSYNNMYNEMERMKSRTVARTVAEELELKHMYFKKGRLKESEMFAGDSPVLLKVLDTSALYKKLDTSFYVRMLSPSQFELLDMEKNVKNTKAFGETFELKEVPFQLQWQTRKIEESIGEEIRIQIIPMENAVNSVVGWVQIAPTDKMSDVLIVSMLHPVRAKARAVINTLVENYQEMDISDKSEIEKNTANFVNERLFIIQAELDAVDKQAEAYKNENKLTDVEKESEQFFRTVNQSEQALFDTNTQLKLVLFMEDYLKKDAGTYGLIPALGFSDPGITALTKQYNEIVLERNRVLRNSTANNPLVQNFNAQLSNLQKSLHQSLQNLEASLRITLEELNKQDTRINNQLGTIPRKEREYRNIVRQQGIKESLYLYLLQKQEETQISLAVIAANSRVIDVAYGSKYPVAPKRNVIMLAGILLGLIIPFSIIYLHDLLDNKMHSRRDLEKVVTAPLLGDIPINPTKEHIVVRVGERSSTAEAFRLLRTNLDFMLDQDKGCQSVFVTSTTSGEGKSFVSVNLAAALALSGKKVALVGMDLRAPKITAYLDVENKKGVTNYIKDISLTIEDIKFNLDNHDNLDIYSSGVIPPNPAELLLHKRVDILFNGLKEKYDYLVVDTAPVNLVTDTLMISKYADMFVYVARADYLDKRLLNIPQNLYRDRRLPNMAMLINGSDYKKSYGYGSYGAYGYGEEVADPWWKTLFKG